MRKSWDAYFLDVAETIATRSTCDRLSVGCVITKNNIQLGEGYNGSISGHEHCPNSKKHICEGGCLNDEQRCAITIHAEQNALLNAMKKGVSVKDGTAYVTHEPCENCSKLLAQAGIKKIVFRNAYQNKLNEHFLKGIEVIHLPKEEK